MTTDHPSKARGSVRRLKSGGYQARLPAAIDPLQRPLLPSHINPTDKRRSWTKEEEAWDGLDQAKVLIKHGHLVLAAPVAPSSTPQPPARTVQIATQDFLKFLEEDHGVNTEKDYASCIRSVICSPTRGLGARLVADLTSEELLQWRSGLRAKGVTRARVKNSWRVLSSMLTWEVEEGRLRANPALGLQPKRRTKNARDRETRDNALLMTWDESADLVFDVEDLANRLMLLTLMWGGPRASEAAALDPIDLRPAAQGVHLARVWVKPTGKPWVMEPLKSGEDRTIELPTALVDGLVALAAANRTSRANELGTLFRSPAPRRQGNGLMTPKVFLEKVLKPARVKAGLVPNPKALDHPHLRGLVTKDLRSFAATMMFDAGAKIEEVRINLGHSSIATTEIYYLRSLRSNSTDSVRLGIQLDTSLTYPQRLDALWNAWVDQYGDPLADLQAYLDTLG